MTHEEIVKELREIKKYLESKAQDIKARYGEKPELENEMDRWHYELLMQVCRTVQECECARSYIRVEVPDMQFARAWYGIEI